MVNNNNSKKVASTYKRWHFDSMKKKQDRPSYSTVASVRLTKAERDAWINHSDRLGLSSNRFFAKAVADYIAMIEQPPGQPIKVPAFLAYCRSVLHGGDSFLKE